MCRFQIIYKIPYPDLGSKQVKTRIAMDSEWYDYKTSLRLVQTHGRGMRFEEDYCKTYFIDNRLRTYVLSSRYVPDDFKALVRRKSNAQVEKLIMNGEELLSDDDYEKAVYHFKKLIRDEVDDWRLYMNLSRAYHELELYEDELNTILMYLNDHPEDLKRFHYQLKGLEDRGYFDMNQI